MVLLKLLCIASYRSYKSGGVGLALYMCFDGVRHMRVLLCHCIKVHEVCSANIAVCAQIVHGAFLRCLYMYALLHNLGPAQGGTFPCAAAALSMCLRAIMRNWVCTISALSSDARRS